MHNERFSLNPADRETDLKTLLEMTGLNQFQIIRLLDDNNIIHHQLRITDDRQKRQKKLLDQNERALVLREGSFELKSLELQARIRKNRVDIINFDKILLSSEAKEKEMAKQVVDFSRDVFGLKKEPESGNEQAFQKKCSLLFDEVEVKLGILPPKPVAEPEKLKVLK